MRPIEDLPLHEVGRSHLLSIDFPAPLPSPQAHDIALDLSRALSLPAHPPPP